jgi:hypothetical protein
MSPPTSGRRTRTRKPDCLASKAVPCSSFTGKQADQRATGRTDTQSPEIDPKDVQHVSWFVPCRRAIPRGGPWRSAGSSPCRRQSPRNVRRQSGFGSDAKGRLKRGRTVYRRRGWPLSTRPVGPWWQGSPWRGVFRGKGDVSAGGCSWRAQESGHLAGSGRPVRCWRYGGLNLMPYHG